VGLTKLAYPLEHVSMHACIFYYTNKNMGDRKGFKDERTFPFLQFNSVGMRKKNEADYGNYKISWIRIWIPPGPFLGPFLPTLLSFSLSKWIFTIRALKICF